MKTIIRHPHFVHWVIFIFFTSLYFASNVGVMNSADATQYALTKSIVEEKSLKIDNYTQYVIPDFATYKNHYYSNRYPGESFLLIPFYILTKVVVVGTNETLTEILALIFMNIIAAGTLVLIYELGYRISRNRKAAFYSALIIGFGTLLWKYGGTFQRYSIQSFFILLSLLLIVRMQTLIKDIKKIPLWYPISISLCWGLAYSVDHLIILSFPVFITTAFFVRHQFRLTLKTIFISGCIFLSFVLLNQFYYYLIFDNFFATGRNFEAGDTKWWLKNPSLVFSSPLTKTLPVVLFNNDKLPQQAISPLIWNDPQLREAESAQVATEKEYKGLFAFSPFLYFAIVGMIILFTKNRKIVLLSIICIISNLLPMALYAEYYNPNSYDIRAFLPTALYLSLGLPVAINYYLKVPSTWVRRLFYTMLLLFILFSVINGWKSLLMHYAPHVEGENRFSFDQLASPIFSQENILPNVALLLKNTFPNYSKLYILYLVYIPLFFIFYFIVINRSMFRRTGRTLPRFTRKNRY